MYSSFCPSSFQSWYLGTLQIVMSIAALAAAPVRAVIVLLLHSSLGP